MNDLEDRLRTTLGDLADGVPSSQHARADLDRRLARRRTKRSTLAVAAAAVVVVAGVAIPVTLSQSGEPAGQRAATSATLTPATPQLPRHVMFLGSFTEEGIDKQAGLVVEDDQWCVVTAVGKDLSGDQDCTPLPTSWPTPGGPGQELSVLSHSVLSGDTLYSGPVPNLMLFFTAPNITTLEVTDGSGALVPVREMSARPDVRIFLADFPETPAGFGYTAKDAAGNVVTSAIT